MEWWGGEHYLKLTGWQRTPRPQQRRHRFLLGWGWGEILEILRKQYIRSPYVYIFIIILKRWWRVTQHQKRQGSRHPAEPEVILTQQNSTNSAHVKRSCLPEVIGTSGLGVWTPGKLESAHRIWSATEGSLICVPLTALTRVEVLLSCHFTHPSSVFKQALTLCCVLPATDDDHSCIAVETFGSNQLLASKFQRWLCIDKEV